MGRRSFDVVDVSEILQHWYAGRSTREIAESLGVARNTVLRYTAPAKAQGLTPGGPPIDEAEWRQRVAGWFPELRETRLRQPTWPAIAAHRDYIAEQMARRVRVSTIHQRLRDERGLACSIAAFRRWIKANLPEEAYADQVRVLRPTPAEPGGEAQVDYGRLGRWADPGTGEIKTVWAFAMVLCASRHLFVRPVLSMDQQAWCAAHVAAFEYFGGTPARLVPDNLKTGVDRPDLYDPKINKAYAELGAHYRVLIDPARAAKPRDKAQVERPMPYIRDSFWRGREETFTSIEHMMDEAVRWSMEVAGKRACRPLDGAAPLEVFTAVEQGALQPLPAEPFELARWYRAKVGPDIHVAVDKVLYSVPWKLIGKTLDARATYSMVQFFHEGELVKTHIRKPRGKQTDLCDYPPDKVAFHMRTPTWCRKKAAEIGPATVEVIDELLADNALYHLRAAQGVLGLADRHDSDQLEGACAKAIAAGDPSYRTIKGILATEADNACGPSSAGDGGAGAFLRGVEGLFGDVISLDQRRSAS